MPHLGLEIEQGPQGLDRVRFGGKGLFVTSTTFTPADEHTIYVGSGHKIYTYDLRMESLLLSVDKSSKVYGGAEDEINQIDINYRATYLAACDDSGDVRVLDLKTDKWMRPLERKHQNIAMTVQFVPKKELQALTGGMDKLVVAWDFYKGRATQLIETVTKKNDKKNKKAPAGSDNWIVGGRLVEAHLSPIATIAYAGFDSDWLVTSANNGTIAVWDDQVARYECFQQQQALQHRSSLQQQLMKTKKPSAQVLAEVEALEPLPMGRPVQPLLEFKTTGIFERVNCIATTTTTTTLSSMSNNEHNNGQQATADAGGHAAKRLLFVAGTHARIGDKKLQGRIAVYQL
ncbi:WD repeat-containing protein 53 [Gryganskiella cystojenkinii]|nr:WD repeat-containing protein 53 [Gryganskiella cystojenkinii]